MGQKAVGFPPYVVILPAEAKTMLTSRGTFEGRRPWQMFLRERESSCL